ncbi:MAG TPA: hypothetical protein VJ280_03515 [Dehalococcoidales bacterium]|nr:hypothetical protein [Dehalococcoidales bacterium]
MRKIYVLIPLFTALILGMTCGCVSRNTTSSTTAAVTASATATTSATPPYDEAEITPGGWRYRADFIQYYLPRVQQDDVIIGTVPNRCEIIYRSNITTPAGETRTNIFFITLVDVSNDIPATSVTPIQVNLVAIDLPDGLIFTSDGEGTESDPWRACEVLTHIQIDKSLKSGGYSFQFDVNVNGTDYGRIPCAIEIVQ